MNDSNKYTKNKLRERFGTCLDYYFKAAVDLQHKQEIRSTDFGQQSSIQTTECLHIQVMHTNSGACYHGGSLDHFIKDCPQNKAMNKYPQHKPSNPPSHLPNKPSYSDYELFQACKFFSCLVDPQSLVILFTNSNIMPSQTRHTIYPNINRISMPNSPKTVTRFTPSM